VHSIRRDRPAGSFTADRYGLYDLGGHVWKRCDDFYPGRFGARVLRGGSFSDAGSGILLSACRCNGDPDRRLDDIGFRWVVSVAAPQRVRVRRSAGGPVVSAAPAAEAGGAISRLRCHDDAI
jgi:hypothetical protein